MLERACYWCVVIGSHGHLKKWMSNLTMDIDISLVFTIPSKFVD